MQGNRRSGEGPALPRQGGAFCVIALAEPIAPLGVKRYCVALMFWMCVHVPVIDPGKT